MSTQRLFPQAILPKTKALLSCVLLGALVASGCYGAQPPAEVNVTPEAPPMGTSAESSPNMSSGDAAAARSGEDATPESISDEASEAPSQPPLVEDEGEVEGSEPDAAPGADLDEADDAEPSEEVPTEAPSEGDGASEPVLDDEGVVDEACVSFEDEVAPLIEASCSSCHNPGLPLAGLNLGAEWAYGTLIEGASAVTGAPFVVPGAPEESYLVAKLGATPPAGGQMPPAPNGLSADQIALVSDWILSGAKASCEPEAPEAPVFDGPTHPVSFEVQSASTQNGNLRVALFESYPSSGPPTLVETVYGVVFPTQVSFPQVPEGAFVAEVVLDVLPYDAASVGPEDLLEKAAFTVSGPASLSVTLSGSTAGGSAEPESANTCGTCPLGLVCGADPNYPSHCAGAPGSCGEVGPGGLCVSATQVAYCVGEGEDARLIALDCTTNAKTTLCGEPAPGSFACVMPPEDTTGAPEPDALDGGCGQCAPGLTCAQDPAFPLDQCSGAPGSCGGLDFAGTCLSGEILLYCSNDSGSGSPLSIDCTLNEELTSCGEISPGVFDCVAPGDAPPTEPQPEIEEEDVNLAFELFAQVHPILEASCSGWLCHQYSGFAQPDLDKAYGVVQDKAFADNILDAIVEGRMPAGNFGLPLCTGDPSVDTDPKCLTQAEIDLVSAWVDAELGLNAAPSGGGGSDDEAAIAVSFNVVHPILEAGCSGFFCHSGGFANQDINVAFSAVVDKNLCEPILNAVQSGAMPPGKGCTGDPTLDAGNPDCLNAEEQAILVDWVLGSDEPCAGPN